MSAIIIDLESLDTKPTGCVVSIGAVAVVQGGIAATFYSEFDTADQMTRGRTICPKTMKWWEEQPDAVRFALEGVKPPPQLVLESFTQFTEKFGEPLTVWGYGSDFDIAMMASLYHSYNMKTPWHYRGVRCLRTLIALAKAADPSYVWQEWNGQKHHALDDAVNEAQMYVKALEILGLRHS